MIDPEPTLEVLVDGYWPRRGPCLICGVPGEDQRHRIMDAVVSLVRAGDPADMVAENYGVPVIAVAIALLAAVEQETDDDGELSVEEAEARMYSATEDYRDALEREGR